MADAQRTIDLIFNGVDKTGAATIAALNNAEKFTGALKDATQPIADFTVGALKIEGALLAAGLAMTTFAVKVAGDFDTAFREISTLIQRPVDELGGFRDAILNYAATSTAPLEQVTRSIYDAISAGVPFEESIAAVAAAERLAIAGKADLNATLRVLVSSLNAYGLSMEEAGAFSDALFTTVRLGQTTLPELANNLSKVTATAATLGVPFEEVLAALAALTATGVPTSEAITQINAVLLGFLKPSAQAAKLADELGVEFGAAAIRSKGLDGALQDLVKATGGSEDQMTRLFGQAEALKAIFPLTGSAAEKFADALVAMADKTGATDEAFTRMADSLGLGAKQVENAFKVLMIAIGTPLLDEFGGIADALAKVFLALSDNVRKGGLGDLVKYIESVFGDIMKTLETVAKNLPAALAAADFSGFQRGIAAVADAFTVLFGNIDLTTVDGLRKAIEFTGAAFLGLSKYTAGVIESFKPLLDLLVRVASGAESVDMEFVTLLGSIGGAVTQLNVLLGVLGPVTEWIGALVAVLVGVKGIGMTAALAGTAVEAGKLALVLGGAGGLLGYVAALAVPIGAIVASLLQWRDAQADLTRAQDAAGAVQERTNDRLRDFAESTGIAVKSLDEALALVDNGTVVWDEASKTYRRAGDAMDRVGTATADAVNPFEAANEAMLAAAVAAEKAAVAQEKNSAATEAAKTYTMQLVPILDELTGKIVGYEQRLVETAGAGATLADRSKTVKEELRTSADVMDRLATSTTLTNKELIDLAKITKDAEVKLAELASNERIKFMEFKVALDVAQIEADTKRIQAAFESINVTIESTGGVISAALGALKDADTWGDIRIIERQLDLENKRRDEALDMQKKLTQAQIDVMRAQIDAMARGDALIQIDGAGLQPHLEAFMWEILRAIQVRVNADGAAMLFGL